MQDSVIQPLTQPFLKLIRANMDLLSGFSTSSEDMSQSLSRKVLFRLTTTFVRRTH